MASDSSSVLELNDADVTDNEAPSVTDDAQEGAPLIMEHGFDIAVKVDCPMKQLSTLETYVTYRVRSVCARWPTPPYVRRRYNHFKTLHKRLSAAHPLVAAPPLPPLHSARQQLDRYSPVFVAVRALALHSFLDRVAKHPILTHSEDFRLFLTTPDDELEKVFKSENSALNLWGLGTFYSSGEPKTTNGARVRDPEFTSAADYLQSLQQKLTTLCALTTKLYKGSVALSTELMSMRRACDAWAVSAGGRVSRGAAAAGAGAGAAAAARGRPPLRHRAQLPLLAAYAAAHADKIRARDALHAAYVSGTNSADDVHNRLEQASEALRSELSDWTPKTRAEVKSILLDLADRQVNLHTQTLIGWENALKLSTEDISQMFKTVSKTAVQNLSPSKCRSIVTPNETERDLDEFDIDEDSDIQDRTQDDRYVTLDVQNSATEDENVNERIHNENVVKTSDLNSNIPKDFSDDTRGHNGRTKSDLNLDVSEVDNLNIHDAVEDGNIDSMSREESSKSESKFSDPLQEFSDVDLS
ncbi:sorting nexin-7-like [Aricia agestis]|uniref:sorting nexin-7-like n=1 Tax=Aricia agestis TaxID=91739 RepID=UPI001C202D30|nr:sorting nexin-7-like [Aricia agestis]